jgi:hypothetical protein
MTAGRLRLALPALALSLLAGCGQSTGKRAPSLSELPLVRGADIVAQVRQCDRGANAFCAWQLVVVDHRYRTSGALVRAEHRLIHKLGWRGADADTGEENSSDSPGHKLRVTYATADGDLLGIDLGWIRRPRKITLALSRVMFDRSSAMSVMLELGTS